jgi:hypothetical protein
MDAEQRLDPRRRERRPERIEIGGEVLLRNDVQARQLGCSERSVDRGDKDGAPASDPSSTLCLPSQFAAKNSGVK